MERKKAKDEGLYIEKSPTDGTFYEVYYIGQSGKCLICIIYQDHISDFCDFDTETIDRIFKGDQVKVSLRIA